MNLSQDICDGTNDVLPVGAGTGRDPAAQRSADIVSATTTLTLTTELHDGGIDGTG